MGGERECDHARKLPPKGLLNDECAVADIDRVGVSYAE
jgi:hypothetical protein